MYNIERQEKILQILEEKRSVTVQKLAELMYASESTIRRDLTELEKSGRVVRTFGGAVLSETISKVSPLLLRQGQNIPAKKQIAKQAAGYVKNGDMIFMDSSSTVSHMIPFLSQFRDLTVVTNFPQASIALGEAGIRNFCTGGLLLEDSFAYVGQYAQEFFRHFHADLLFFSCRGFHPETGDFTDASIQEVEVRRVMLRQAKRKILLCDSSKFGKVYPHILCNRDEIDLMISDVDL